MSIVALVILAVAIGTTEAVPYSLIALLDTPLIQITVLGICIGLAYVSPMVGLAAAVVLTMIYVIRNYTKLRIKQTLSSLSQPSIKEVRTEAHEEHAEVMEQHAPVASEEVPPGQYPTDENRPEATGSIREFEYSPFEDTGKNDWTPVYNSIDEKVPPISIQPWRGSPNMAPV